MKKLLITLIIALYSIAANAQTRQYTNPILSGFYPDPSICRVGNDYYLVNSTFAYFPGIPVFHSKDLVNWQLIGHVITRTEQMDFTGMGVSRAIFAPTIRYNKGVFYVTCTLVDGKGNFVVTAKDPAGPWSNPYWLPQVDGIDPSLFFDDNDKPYIIYNSIPPDNKSLYNGHRTIRINEFDYKKMVIVSDNKILINGGTDLSKKPSWIEGPHIIKKNGYYYLIAAEGGTGADHSVVAFRSKTLDQLFIPYEKNPILTQRNLNGPRKYPITSTGHADLVELPDGSWQTIFLGTRPYEGDYYNTGRETFLAPVVWKDEWPTVNPGSNEVQYHYSLPLPEQTNKKNTVKYSGNFSYKDDFNNSLGNDWIFLRNVKEKWYNLNDKKGFLSIQLRPETASGVMNPSFIVRRQQHLTCAATTSLTFHPVNANEKAGLMVFQNETHFYYLCKSNENNKNVVQLYQSPKNVSDSNQMILVASQVIPSLIKNIQLRIEADKDKYAFYFNTDRKWQLLKDNVDGKFLSTRIAGGFVGCTIGLYATSLGKQSTATANYDWFEYSGNDEVYK